MITLGGQLRGVVFEHEGPKVDQRLGYVAIFPSGQKLDASTFTAQCVLHIALRCELLLEAQRAARERTICLACGCLCLLDEHCPGCRAAREADRRAS